MGRDWLDTVWYRFFTASCRAFHGIYAPIEAYGVRHVPLNGRVLIVSNHQSLLDPFILAITCPRRLFYAAKKEIFEIPIVGPAARSYGMFPVDRSRLDISAAKKALRILNQEKALAILPEATRSASGDLLPFTAGFVNVAIRSEAPVVPTSIVGSWRVWPKHRSFPRPGRIRIAYGEPMDLADGIDGPITPEVQRTFGEQVRSLVSSLSESLESGHVGSS